MSEYKSTENRCDVLSLNINFLECYYQISVPDIKWPAVISYSWVNSSWYLWRNFEYRTQILFFFCISVKKSHDENGYFIFYQDRTGLMLTFFIVTEYLSKTLSSVLGFDREFIKVLHNLLSHGYKCWLFR